VIYTELGLSGVWLVELERREDERGFFARAWCRDELRERGLESELAQCNLSFNERRGTLRGLHYQAAPHGEVKLVRCTRGAIFDVVVDLRPGSPTHGEWLGVELNEENRSMLYVPEGCAHGYQTLVDRTETFYQVSRPYTPEAERGVRWDDPAFDIRWPEAERRVLSAKDRSWTDSKVSVPET